MSTSSDTSSETTSSSTSDYFDSTSTTSTSFSDQEDGSLLVAAARFVNRSSLSNNRPPRRLRQGPDPDASLTVLEALEDEDDEEESSGTPKEKCSICLMSYRQTDTLNGCSGTTSAPCAVRAWSPLRRLRGGVAAEGGLQLDRRRHRRRSTELVRSHLGRPRCYRCRVHDAAGALLARVAPQWRKLYTLQEG
ncbi:uncharacterized protein LOC144136425 isoform X1 [Amblyomma americanum]